MTEPGRGRCGHARRRTGARRRHDRRRCRLHGGSALRPPPRRAARRGGVDPGTLRAAVRSGTLLGRLGLTDVRGGPLCAAVRPPLVTWSAGTPDARG
ncbi:DUF5990 family protein [Streptomyces sp. BoleA5]|uniref:DUF5990 family protein n=1 Tax=Streptomyces sp. BoleA5 TaxID=1157637 RepID=UPI003B6340F8